MIKPHMKEIQKQILNIIKTKHRISMAELVDKFGFSRAYLNRVINELIQDNLVVRIGQTNNVRYVLNTQAALLQEKIIFRGSYPNKGLDEYRIFRDIVNKNRKIFADLNKNVYKIIEFTFSEMLNNAIEHSQTDKIDILISRLDNKISFFIKDYGVGILNNLIEKKRLSSQYEAIQDLLKGKQTTEPELHSGQGIFFTSKIADRFIIFSQEKSLIFDNNIDDIFIKSKKKTKGTRILFEISLKSKKKLVDIFNQFSDSEHKFDTTNIKVKLYQYADSLVSRSQARRILSGLDDFSKIILDFGKVDTVGQGFADEIFRVYKNKYPDKKIEYINFNPDVEFMIKRSL